MRLAAVMKKNHGFYYPRPRRGGFASAIASLLCVMAVVVQIGTPEEIVMHPADEIRPPIFVAGISRLKIVRAHAVMESLDDWQGRNGALADGAAQCDEQDNLSTLIDAAIKNRVYRSQLPVTVVNGLAW